MTKKRENIIRADVKHTLAEDRYFLYPLMQWVLQEVLEAFFPTALRLASSHRPAR